MGMKNHLISVLICLLLINSLQATYAKSKKQQLVTLPPFRVYLPPDRYQMSHVERGLLDDAIDLARHGHVAEAVKKLENDADPPDVRRNLVQAGLLLEIGRFDESFAEYEEVERTGQDQNNREAISNFVNSLRIEKTLRNQRKLMDSIRESDAWHWTQENKPENVYIERQILFWSKPVKVWIAASPYSQLVVDAFREWSDASSNGIEFSFVQEAGQADIICQLENNKASGAIAEVNLKVDSQAHISQATMELSFDWQSHLCPATKQRIKRLCLIAVGRACGLTGISTDPNDILYGHQFIANKEPVLSSRDRQNIYRLYKEDRKIHQRKVE